MGDLWFQFVARNDRDRTALHTEITRKMTAEDAVGYETMLRANPRDAELHDDVAVLYLSLGRAADAVRHFRASAEVKPDAASSHFNLATALSVNDQLDEAVSAYREALRLRPDYAAAHNNLGTVLATQGQIAVAIPHFRAAARADAANVQAHRNLAWYLTASGGADPATMSEAIAAGQRAVALTGERDADALEALAAAYKAAGQADNAAAATARALRLRNGG
jgi:tetratricopeptide (TPR) repeat protein